MSELKSNVEPARARVGLRLQDNLGDFLLLTTSIDLEASAWADRGESVDELLERLYDKVSDKLVEKVVEARRVIKEL